MIGITERARKEVRRIIHEQKLPGETALRVGVKGGGCSGFSYTLGFDDQVAETDQIEEVEGVKVVCDPQELPVPERHGDRFRGEPDGARIQVRQPECVQDLRLRRIVQRVTVA